jgi:hypothetical protein
VIIVTFCKAGKALNSPYEKQVVAIYFRLLALRRHSMGNGFAHPKA